VAQDLVELAKDIGAMQVSHDGDGVDLDEEPGCR
jgi:hypothetical protein